MNRNSLSPSDYNRLLEAIAPIIKERGLKATTMDLVASRLGMSKRTLYEIFESKNEMAGEVLENLHLYHINNMRKLFETSPNVLEAWVKLIRFHGSMMRGISADFFRDMDHHFKEVRGHYRQLEDERRKEMENLFERGVDEGVFRPDLNFKIQGRIFEIQMESLKRMEQLFPKDISPAEVYNNICIGFLRSIVTPKGLEMLESLIQTHLID